MATLAPKLPYTHPFAGGFPYRGSTRLPSDPDALTYLAAVAAADGAPVEVGVATAVDDFFKGCKADGTFGALKAACLLCGARTLAGALVPLKNEGPELWGAPTPTIIDSGGSSGAWDSATSTMRDDAAGDSTINPRFRFNIGMQAGSTYKVVGALSGDTSSIASVRLAVSGGTNYVSYDAGTGVLSGTLASASDTIEFIFNGTRGPSSVTIESLSIREAFAAPTNNNFVDADYDRETGLKGNGSTKYLDSGRAGDDDPLEDHHMACYATEASAVVTHTKMGAFQPGVDAYELVRAADRAYFYSRSSESFFTGVGVGNQTGLHGYSRTGSTLNSRAGGVDYTATRAAVARAGVNIFVFGYNDGSSMAEPSGGRLAYYSIGTAISDLALLDARVTTLVTSIGAAL